MTKPKYRRTSDGKTFRVADGLTNVVANLGTARDKAAASGYSGLVVSDTELLNAYRFSWLPRKLVDIPALDATRRWREWQAEKPQIEAIEREELRLGIKRKVLAAQKAARLFGGAAIMIGTGDNDPMKPLNVDAVRRGGLRYVTVLLRRHLSPGMTEDDPSADGFGKPRYWTVSPGSQGQIDVHASRLVIFTGADVIDDTMTINAGLGDSVLLSAFEAVRNVDAAAGNIASLLFEAKVDTVGIPNLMQNLGDSAYEEKLLTRWRLAEIGKGINGTLMHDAEEILGQKQAPTSGLADVLDRFMMLASGAADIPMTRLMGQSPAGLSSTGDADLRNYYDRVSALQELEIGPAMALLDECLIRSALGARPVEVHYRWASLWQISDKERADIGQIQATTIKTLAETMLYPDEALAEAGANAITETGAMPGFEGALDRYHEESPVEGDPEAVDPAAENDPEPSAPEQVGDAAPRPLYVRRDVLNGDEIIAWAKAQGFAETLAADDLHVTITYSRSPVDWMAMGEAWDDEIEIKAGGPRAMDQFGEAKVLLIASSRLSWRHREMVEAGASYDHGEYQPHITISYDVNGPDIAAIQPYLGKIVLGPEIFEDVNDNWRNKDA